MTCVGQQYSFTASRLTGTHKKKKMRLQLQPSWRQSQTILVLKVPLPLPHSLLVSSIVKPLLIGSKKGILAEVIGSGWSQSSLDAFTKFHYTPSFDFADSE